MAKKAKSRSATQVKKAPANRLAKRKGSPITAENVFEHILLKHIRLIDVRSHLEIRDGKLPVHAKISSGAAVMPSNGTIRVNATIDIEGRPADADEGSSVVTIHLLYQCVFEPIDRALEDFESLSDTLAKLGMLMTWPYFRESVHAITLQMGIPPFVIPMFVPDSQGGSLVSLSKIRQSKGRSR